VVSLQLLSRVTFEPDGQSVQKMVGFHTLEASGLTLILNLTVLSTFSRLVLVYRMSCCCDVVVDGGLSDDTDTNPVCR
jgi:hypothetical protein